MPQIYCNTAWNEIMFENLKDKLATIFTTLGKQGALSEADVKAALREVRLALLEADVALPVVKHFEDNMREKAIGADLLKSVRPDQQVIKIVNDGLIDMLGGQAQPLKLEVTPPAVIMLVGLQGSGKTTTAGKLALRLKHKAHKKVMLASLDLTRPAAREQLRILAESVDAGILPESDTQTPVQLAKTAHHAATLQGYDVLILDTAGRLAMDEALMAELRDIKTAAPPHEILLVADSLTGQDAVVTAGAFHEALGLTGLILTRLDGDGRGGAALSMAGVTKCPIKMVGIGEKLEDLEEFDPIRMADRILDKGDIVALVEKAAEVMEEDEAVRMATRMAKGQFDMNDFLSQLRQVQKMGGIGGMLGMLPGLGKLQKQMKAGLDEDQIKRQEAIILSMTKKERRSVALLNASRRKRIASGSGTHVQEVNKLVKTYQNMAKMMKKMGTKSGMQAMQSMLNGGGAGGLNSGMGGGALPAPQQMAELTKSMDNQSGGNQFGGGKGADLSSAFRGGVPNFGTSSGKK